MIALELLAHAAFRVTTSAGRTLCIDPYPDDGWGGRIQAAPVGSDYDLAIATHHHADHYALDATGGAAIASPYAEPGLRIESTVAAHDEYGGRLRGGTSLILRLTLDDHVIVHCGDLGERPTGALLEWLLAVPIDVLIVPAGGYFTLGPTGAAELAALVRPTFVTPCHTASDGFDDDRLHRVDAFLRHFDRVVEADRWSAELRPAAEAPTALRLTPQRVR